MAGKVKLKHLVKHETKKGVLFKFILLLAVFLVYFVFISLKFGTKKGLLVSLLTWSFFVLCTPVADAGLLFDFPIRIITGIRMVILEVFVWIFAIFLNITTLLKNPNIYQTTVILKILHKILTKPWPYWLIIVLAAVGTFSSIIFGDELLDTIKHHQRKLYHKHRHHYTAFLSIALFIIAFFFYRILLKELHLSVF